MPPLNMDLPSNGSVFLQLQVLSQDSFSSFGTVIENPAPSLVPSPQMQHLPPNAVQANQGTALKYVDVTHLRSLYGSATPSKTPAKAVMNMFVCAPRPLLPSKDDRIEGLFRIEILERHPYTTQTFIPLGLSKDSDRRGRYLVVVAPSLPHASADIFFPASSPTAGVEHLPGRGLPDLKNVKAFISNGSQAVTYGPGTWHAPMVALGADPVQFIVVQFTNGVSLEDCQEVKIGPKDGSQLLVAIPEVDNRRYSKSKI